MRDCENFMEKYNKKKEEEAKAAGAVTAIAVDNKNGNFARAYTLAVHGEAFKQLAEEFADKTRGKTRKANDAEIAQEEKNK